MDNGNSVIPLGDPLFASALALRNQVASVEETHVFSPRLLNTFRAGFSRSGFNYDSFSTVSFPADLSFVTGFGPGGIVGRRRADHHRVRRPYGGGPEQQCERLESPQSVHLLG